MAKTTKLNKWYYLVNEGEIYPTYTRDSWTIPEEGTEIWCTGWKRGQTIRPYGDGCHEIVGLNTYHCDELMEILAKWEAEGHQWGIEGVTMEREQQINSYWQPVERRS